MIGLELDAFGHTHIGQRRASNQDNYLCLPLGPGPWGYLLAVADGMGGHAGGEVASELAVEALRETFRKELGGAGSVGPEELLWRALQRANGAILERAAGEGLQGMGTTLVAAVVVPDRVWLANVGDSRAYRIRDGRIEQLTSDHSWEAEKAPKLGLDAAEIAVSPFRGMLTRSLGNRPALEVDVHAEDTADHDTLLLCSDGVYRELDEQRLGSIVTGNDSAERICRDVIQQGNSAGGNDNLTCVVACIGPLSGTDESSRSSARTQSIPTLGGASGREAAGRSRTP